MSEGRMKCGGIERVPRGIAKAVAATWEKALSVKVISARGACPNSLPAVVSQNLQFSASVSIFTTEHSTIQCVKFSGVECTRTLLAINNMSSCTPNRS